MNEGYQRTEELLSVLRQSLAELEKDGLGQILVNELFTPISLITNQIFGDDEINLQALTASVDNILSEK